MIYRCSINILGLKRIFEMVAARSGDFGLNDKLNAKPLNVIRNILDD